MCEKRFTFSDEKRGGSKIMVDIFIKYFQLLWTAEALKEKIYLLVNNAE